MPDPYELLPRLGPQRNSFGSCTGRPRPLALFGDGTEVASQPADPRARAEQYLRDNAVTLGLRPDIGDLRLLSVREGPSEQHVRYQQTFNGLPVSGAFITVSLPKAAQLEPSLVSRYVSGLQAAPARANLTAGAPA